MVNLLFHTSSKGKYMNIAAQIAKHFKDIYTGGNWTSVNLKETLADVTWQQANIKIDSLNTIALLVYHINYYVSAVLKVLQGEELKASDKFSFDVPLIQSQEDWEKLVEKTFADAALFAKLVEQLPDNKLNETFANEKYGNYYRNIHGIIEHTHYHLGQIVILKKLIHGNVDVTNKTG
jgi:DinB superfamily